MRCWPGLLRTTIAERTARFPEYAEILKGQLCAVTHTYCLQYVSPTSFQKECVNPKLNLHTSDAVIAASPALALDIMNSFYPMQTPCLVAFASAWRLALATQEPRQGAHKCFDVTSTVLVAGTTSTAFLSLLPRLPVQLYYWSVRTNPIAPFISIGQDTPRSKKVSAIV